MSFLAILIAPFRFHSFESQLTGAIISNKNHLGHHIVTSRHHCLNLCVNEPACKSVNLCIHAKCQLNIEDAFTKAAQFKHDKKNCLLIMNQKKIESDSES